MYNVMCYYGMHVYNYNIITYTHMAMIILVMETLAEQCGNIIIIKVLLSNIMLCFKTDYPGHVVILLNYW